MINKDFTIREPGPTLLTSIGVAFIITAYIGVSYYFIKNRQPGDPKTYIALLVLAYYVFNYMVLPYIVTRVAHINFTEQQIKNEYEIGPIIIRKKWKELKDLEYISVFKVEDAFRVNLWYKKKKILNLFMTYEVDEAFENAFKLSEKFNVDLVDATVKGHHEYVDKLHYKSHNEIRHL